MNIDYAKPDAARCSAISHRVAHLLPLTFPPVARLTQQKTSRTKMEKWKTNKTGGEEFFKRFRPGVVVSDEVQNAAAASAIG